jgi:hypothetical protein
LKYRNIAQKEQPYISEGVMRSLNLKYRLTN